MCWWWDDDFHTFTTTHEQWRTSHSDWDEWMRDITKLEQVNFHSHVELGGKIQMSCDVGYLNQTNMCGMMGLIIVKLCPTTIGKWGLREWVEMERCGIGWECGLLVEVGFGFGWFDDSWDMMGGEQQPPSIKWMNWKMVFETIDWVVCGRSVDSVRPRLMMIGYEWGGVEFVLRILEGWLMVRMWGVGMNCD